MRREVYGFLDMLEDIGGVKEVLISIMGIVLYSLGKQSYNLKFIKELFLLRQPAKEGNQDGSINTVAGENFYRIKLRKSDRCRLWATNYFGSWIFCGLWKNQKKVTDLYKEGCERIEHGSNWSKVTKNMLHLDEALKDTVLTPEIEHKIKFSE